MRIQHNIMAMSAYRNYTNNVSAMKKNLEKLSSGYKINRAGDDAAGLAISEKMRAQITGLETAQKNAKDGISLVQTAEGALTEVHDMLNRMVELATMSANGTYDNTTDRAQLQKEMDQLTSEINRIADSANFNGIKLLDGSMDAGGETTVTEGSFQLAANHDGAVSTGAIALPATSANKILGTDTVLHEGATKAGTTNEFSIELHNLATSNDTGSSITIQIGSEKFTLKAADTGKADTALTATDIATAFKEGKFVVGDKDATTAMTAGEATIDGTKYTVTSKGGKITFSTTDDLAAGKTIPKEITVTGNGGAAVGAQEGTKAKGDISMAWDTTPTWATDDTVTIEAKNGDITFTATAKKTATGWDVTGGPDGYTATFDGSKLTLEATAVGKKTDVDLGDLTATIGTYDAGGTKPTATPVGAITDGTNAVAAKPAGTDPLTGDYNKSTTDILTKTEATNERLASTWFKLDDLATNSKISDGTTLTIGKDTYTFTTDASKAGETGYVVMGENDTLTKIAEKLTDAAAANATYTVGHDGTKITVTEVKDQKNFDLTTMDGIEESLGFSKSSKSAETGKGLTLQIGDTADSFNQLKVSIKDMHAASLKLDTIKISDQDSAAKAVDVIKNAINMVSDVRGTLGATQNRLDHTINNLSVMTENIQDAESTIRDVDVAEEMMAYTKNNILIQSAQAMLAQANQVPQGVLQLLQ